MSSHLRILIETIHILYYINVIKCLCMCYEILIKRCLFMHDNLQIKCYLSFLMAHSCLCITFFSTLQLQNRGTYKKNASLLTLEHFFEISLFQT